jgi:single-strand DNA-binding protein
MNRVLIMGNLGADPELRHTTSGTPVTTLSVATTHAFTDKDGQAQETTEWHRVVVWGKQAENCVQYLGKGRAVLVEGRLATRSWEDQNGEKRYQTEIIASTVQFLGGGDPAHRAQSVAQARSGSSERTEHTVLDDGAPARSAPARKAPPKVSPRAKGGRPDAGRVEIAETADLPF